MYNEDERATKKQNTHSHSHTLSFPMTSQARLCKQSSVLQLEHLVANAGPVWVEAACKQLQAPRTLGLLQWGCRCWRGCMACLLLLLTVDAATAAAAVVVVAAAAAVAVVVVVVAAAVPAAAAEPISRAVPWAS